MVQIDRTHEETLPSWSKQSARTELSLSIYVQFRRYVVDPTNAGRKGASQEDCDNIVRVREHWKPVPEPDT